MTISSIGDQARAFAMRAATSRLKASMEILTQELSSGEVADLGLRLGGNTRALSSIEARLVLNEQFQRNASEAAAFAAGMQDALQSIRTSVSDMSISLLSEPVPPTPAMLAARAYEVSEAFSTTVSRLNGDIAGQHLFAGLDTDQVPLISAEEMLDQLQVATAGQTTAAGVALVVSDWFDAPPGGGGFLDTAYSGTVGATRRFSVGEDISIGLSTSAASPAIRDLLKGLATAALVDRGVLAGQHDERRALMAQGAHVLVDNDAGLVSEMSRIGLAEQIIDRAATHGAGVISTLTIGRNTMRSADQYETSAALQQVESQLEAVYAVTARLSDLRLVEYLR